MGPGGVAGWMEEAQVAAPYPGTMQYRDMQYHDNAPVAMPSGPGAFHDLHVPQLDLPGAQLMECFSATLSRDFVFGGPLATAAPSLAPTPPMATLWDDTDYLQFSSGPMSVDLQVAASAAPAPGPASSGFSLSSQSPASVDDLFQSDDVNMLSVADSDLELTSVLSPGLEFSDVLSAPWHLPVGSVELPAW